METPEKNTSLLNETSPNSVVYAEPEDLRENIYVDIDNSTTLWELDANLQKIKDFFYTDIENKFISYFNINYNRRDLLLLAVTTRYDTLNEFRDLLRDKVTSLLACAQWDYIKMITYLLTRNDIEHPLYREYLCDIGIHFTFEDRLTDKYIGDNI